MPRSATVSATVSATNCPDRQGATFASVVFDGVASLVAAHISWELVFMGLLAAAAVFGYPDELLKPEQLTVAMPNKPDAMAGFFLLSHVKAYLPMRAGLAMLVAPWFQSNIFDGYTKSPSQAADRRIGRPLDGYRGVVTPTGFKARTPSLRMNQRDFYEPPFRRR